MATFKVFHRTVYLFTPNARDNERFEHVATVETAELGSVFGLTNHIDAPWWENEGVTLIGAPRHRSTSVGDEVLNVNTGERWVVEGCGWSKVGA